MRRTWLAFSFLVVALPALAGTTVLAAERDGPESAAAAAPAVSGTHALPGTFVETPVHVGPFSDANGNLYFLNELAEESPTATMRKSTDGGRTWSVADPEGRPTSEDWEAADVVQHGDTLHIFLNEGDDVGARYFTFHTSDHPSSPDTWGVTDEDVTVPVSYPEQQAAALTRRGDGTLAAFYSQEQDGADKLFYKVRSAQGQWSDEQTLEAESSVDWRSVVAITDADDTSHVMYYGTDGTIWYRTLSADGTLSGRTLMTDDAGTSVRNAHPFVPPVRWVSDGDEKLLFLYSQAGGDEPWRLHSRIITNGGAPAASTVVTPGLEVAQDAGSYGSRQPVATAATDGARAMVIFAARDGSSTSDTDHLWYTESVDGGDWTPEEILLDRADFHHQDLPDQVFMIRGRVVEHTGGRAFGFVADQEPTGGTDGSFYAEIPLGPATGPGPGPGQGMPFSDVDPDNVHAPAIRRLAELDILRGWPDGTFRPSADLSRGQMAAVVARTLDLDDVGDGPFPDVDPSGTHAGAINALAAEGIVRGTDDGRFRLHAGVTRAQLSSMLARAGDLPAGDPEAFPDIAGSVHAGAIAALADAGIVRGYPDGTFRPSVVVRRGQAAGFLDGFLDLLEAR